MSSVVTHPPRQSLPTSRKAPVCIACGERERFRVAVPGGEVEVRRRADCTPAMRLIGCGRCGNRHTVVLEDAWG